MILAQVVLLVFYTLVLGTAGIVVCLVVPGGRALIPLARLWSRLVLATFRVRSTAVFHPGVDPARPCVYVANHQSQMDIPALALAMPADFRIVAKRGLLYVPVFGWALWMAGFVFIDRSDRDRAISSLERAAERIRRGTSIVIFAEGTRSPDGRLQPFKKGGFVMAIRAGAPIVPVSIRGGHAILPKGSWRVRPGAMEVVFGAPLDTRDYDPETRDALMEEVRRRIAAGLRST